VTADEGAATRGEPAAAEVVDSASAWLRLGIALVLGTIGSVGMWSYVVVLPSIQAEFSVARADASLPYTLTMAGFGIGGVVMGRAVDRFGIVIPIALGALALGCGYVGASLAPSLSVLAAMHLLVGFGASTTFGPLMTDISHWFKRRRGIAVAISSSGNYLAGVVWPPLIQSMVEAIGWRQTHLAVGIVCVAIMLPLVLALRNRTPVQHAEAGQATINNSESALGLSPRALQTLLSVAGVACCVAMAMPQVHIVAYCGDLGYGVARGAEMLSLMLGFGIVSRIATGWIADHIGGLRTLLLGSVLQTSALVLYVFFDGMISLYIISALFGLFQGGIVPSYAIIVREYFSPREAGARLGVILLATLVGMAFGGWISGVIFDYTGSYQAAFVNGVLWNLLNAGIAFWLLSRSSAKLATA
jgi:MFS family permease